MISLSISGRIICTNSLILLWFQWLMTGLFNTFSLVSMISFCCTNYNRSAMLPEMLKTLAAQQSRDFEFVLTDFHSTDGDLARTLRASGLKHKLLQVDGPFSRSKGLNAAEEHAGGEIVFFTDTDMLYPKGFMHLLKSRVRPGIAYFPMCYKLNQGCQPVVRGNSKNRIAANGNWHTGGYGMCGFNRDDFRRIGRWDESFVTWGGEDKDIHRRARAAGIRTLRSRCLGLLHRWHPKHSWTDGPAQAG
jgi:glycosyltransferase involved in cell wall biosynthesis